MPSIDLSETTVRVLDPGRGKTKTGYMWTMVRDERALCGADTSGCVYEHAPGRSGNRSSSSWLRISGKVDGVFAPGR